LEQIAEQGLGVLPELVRIVINTAMQAEREAYLGAAAYERTESRRGQANGYKAKTVTTRVGPVTFDVPQVRQGVSTRKVAAITEQMCGTAISSTQVSRAAALLDEELSAWRSRPLGRCPFLFLDARYEKVRQSGQVRDAAVLLAVGVNDQGKGRCWVSRSLLASMKSTGGRS
jgi:transposase-like protein